MTTTDSPRPEPDVPEPVASTHVESRADPDDTVPEHTVDGGPAWTDRAPTEPMVPADGRTRASHAEREATIMRLHSAVGEGRLDLDEADERSTAVYRVRYRDELSAFVADLPADPGRYRAGDAPTWLSIWESVVWRVLMVLRGEPVPRPSTRQLRTGAVTVVLAAVWFLMFVAVGAGVVA